MLFKKYCTWPSDNKKDKIIKINNNNCDNEKMLKNVFNWCPVFGCKNTKIIESNLESASFNRFTIPKIITTPVIPLKNSQIIKEMYEKNEKKK